MLFMYKNVDFVVHFNRGVNNGISYKGSHLGPTPPMTTSTY
jgi:hypothetical protein